MKIGKSSSSGGATLATENEVKTTQRDDVHQHCRLPVDAVRDWSAQIKEPAVCLEEVINGRLVDAAGSCV